MLIVAAEAFASGYTGGEPAAMAPPDPVNWGGK